MLLLLIWLKQNALNGGAGTVFISSFKFQISSNIQVHFPRELLWSRELLQLRSRWQIDLMQLELFINKSIFNLLFLIKSAVSQSSGCLVVLTNLCGSHSWYYLLGKIQVTLISKLSTTAVIGFFDSDYDYR